MTRDLSGQAKGVKYRIEQIDSRGRVDFGIYEYRIYANDRHIARYWHDCKADEHGIEFLSGTQEKGWPFRTVTEFITGGGPEPLTLSQLALAYLARRSGSP